MNTVKHANKLLVEQLYRDCINAGRLDLLEDLIHPQYVGSAGEKGPGGFMETLLQLRDGFPGIQFTLEDVIAERDRVVAMARMEEAGQRSLSGFSANHRLPAAIAIFQIKDSRIVRAWLQLDRLGPQQQAAAIAPLASQASMEARPLDQGHASARDTRRARTGLRLT